MTLDVAIDRLLASLHAERRARLDQWGQINPTEICIACGCHVGPDRLTCDHCYWSRAEK